MRVGDKVGVINKDSCLYGKVGKIVEICPPHLNGFRILFPDDSRGMYFAITEIVLVSEEKIEDQSLPSH